MSYTGYPVCPVCGWAVEHLDPRYHGPARQGPFLTNCDAVAGRAADDLIARVAAVGARADRSRSEPHDLYVRLCDTIELALSVCERRDAPGTALFRVKGIACRVPEGKGEFGVQDMQELIEALAAWRACCAARRPRARTGLSFFEALNSGHTMRRPGDAWWWVDVTGKGGWQAGRTSGSVAYHAEMRQPAWTTVDYNATDWEIGGMEETP